ncbi:WecB/TagA/CpsF family glycosyltransferase [Jeotgalibacillus sp. JSM ZJ347]|uniref:WecB/TagA/CpsF family glycosyltransferase n=1 Tax=Jeotgalibacillus sp. JSM ZJ347 TaxID=3342117 RepID=UPI0035A90EEE
MNQFKEEYLGVKVSALNYAEILSEIDNRIQEGEQSTVIAVNPEKVIKAQDDPEIKRLINESTFQIPDGAGILLASRLKKGKIRNRVTGIDMMDHLLGHASKQGYRVFFYGAKEEIVKKARDNIKEKYPALHVAGYANGYIKDNDALIEEINKTKADIVFVAMGSPRQEYWIEQNRAQLNAKVFQGVGGSFDVFSGTIPRAPHLFRRLGLEWLYRLMKEPSRWKRQMALPKFLVKVLRG